MHRRTHPLTNNKLGVVICLEIDPCSVWENPPFFTCDFLMLLQLHVHEEQNGT